MALPANNIFLRSPYWVNKSRSILSYIIVDLTVWTGELVADEPVSPSLKLRSTAFENTASIDIAEFARDLVEVTFNGAQDSNAVWVKTQVTWFDADGATGTDAAVYYTGLDGFSYFEQGVNYSFPYNVLLGTDKVRVLNNTDYKIPVLQDKLTGYGLQYWAGYAWIEYHTVIGLSPVQDTDSVIKYVNSSYSGTYADRVRFVFSSGPTEYVYVNYESCPKYNSAKIFFVNRYGATQQIDTFGRVNVDLTTKDEKYKRNLMNGAGSYDITRHQNTVLSKNGTISLTVNTGYYKDTENDIFTELMLSEQVWMIIDKDQLGLGWMPKETNSFVVPVNITSNTFNMKQNKIEKLINYTFTFEVAADRINSVR